MRVSLAFAIGFAPIWVPLCIVVAWASEPPKVERVKIPVHPKDLQVCAPYTSTAFPRDVQWSCKDATEIAHWILTNGRPTDECEEKSR